MSLTLIYYSKKNKLYKIISRDHPLYMYAQFNKITIIMLLIEIIIFK